MLFVEKSRPHLQVNDIYMKVSCVVAVVVEINTLRPRQNDNYFADDILNAFYWKKMCEFC